MTEQQRVETVNTATDAEKQQNDPTWPKPGDEGYVIPDGTPQAREQLAANRRAAADRAAAGSVVHGAPLATPGPQAHDETEAAAVRAEEYSGPTIADAQEGTTRSIREGLEAAADNQTPAVDVADTSPKTSTTKTRTADQQSGDKTAR